MTSNTHIPQHQNKKNKKDEIIQIWNVSDMYLL